MKTLLVSLAAMVLLASPASGATSIEDAGVLTGATGVKIGGSLYDVSFASGSCMSVFSGCDSPSDFDFTSEASALLAAEALLAQVFIGVNDTEPNRTRGCSNVRFCNTIIPHTALGGQFLGATAFNSNELVDTVSGFGQSRQLDFTNTGVVTFARFTISAVPEPSTWALMLIGFCGAGIALRRRRNLSINMQSA